VGSERRAVGNFNDAALIAEGVNHDEVQSERYVAHAVSLQFNQQESAGNQDHCQ